MAKPILTANAPKRPSPADLKLQRWIDLLATLLRHHYGLTFEQLRAEVPTYAASTDAGALARMFERDKDELRAFGIPLVTMFSGDDEPQRYRIEPREMYLPYLLLAARSGEQGAHDTRAPKQPAGYRSLPTLTFEPDELRALVQAAREVATIGDPALSTDAAAALRKLAYDLDVPVDSVLGEGRDPVIAPREPATAGRIRQLGDALLRLKRVSFTYRSMSSDETSLRETEPYGLFFTNGHWYLAARDIGKGDVRNFRVSRMDAIRANRGKPQSVDYAIPASFHLSDHAKARGPWELGDGEAEPMVVELRGDSGATVAALRLGAKSSLGERHREFRVRRIDSFVRWLLSFAGEAVPVAPPRLIDEYRRAALATLDVYGGHA